MAAFPSSAAALTDPIVATSKGMLKFMPALAAAFLLLLAGMFTARALIRMT